ncbi:hypothetical protein BDY21DRAFT_95272 [Lineolata rhizophorae]|uniref:Uncharacterized protein n=1 Tax=Lineolata rhizophorae TaxID=578093 RepID=A0A6A6NSX0_9PEZI|nr:hypothetical protein BDY21DRAFT_95272 [Lineolata rhizophorae]
MPQEERRRRSPTSRRSCMIPFAHPKPKERTSTAAPETQLLQQVPGSSTLPMRVRNLARLALPSPHAAADRLRDADAEPDGGCDDEERDEHLDPELLPLAEAVHGVPAAPAPRALLAQLLLAQRRLGRPHGALGVALAAGVPHGRAAVRRRAEPRLEVVLVDAGAGAASL